MIMLHFNTWIATLFDLVQIYLAGSLINLT
jgi:hypothetical protein